MFFDEKLNMTIKEIDTESQLLDILMKNPKKKKELSKNKAYAKLIKRFEEGGLI
jgi:hypothetical protein